MNYNDDLRYIAEQLDKELNGISKIVTELGGDKTDDPLIICDIKEKALDRFIIENKNVIHDRLFTFYKPIFDGIEKLGYKIERDGEYVYLINYSPLGEELYETIYLDGEEGITFQLYKLYDNFDEEDHVYALLEAKKNGLGGIPSMKELIQDAEYIQEMFNELQLTAYNLYPLCRKAA